MGDVRIEIAPGVASLDRVAWNAVVADDSPFLEWEWLASLEDAGCLGARSGWQARPLVAFRGDRLVAACPLYAKSNSEGEFVFDHAFADAAERAGLAYYPKLLVGAPFTPVTGGRLLVHPALGEAEAEALRAAMAEALVSIAAESGLSSVHVNFCRETEAAGLEHAGFLRRVGIQYHWHNEGYADFDDYLGRFRSKRRNQVRRERRDVRAQGVCVEVHADGDIDDALFEPMYAFYLSTIRARYWGRQYLNRAFFDLLRERFRERLVFVVARRDGAPVAGAFNVAKGDALYGRYWGEADHVRNLHFEVCYYAGIEHCIERGLARFEPGAGGEYKQVRGFDARPTFSAHRFLDERLHAAVARFLEQERMHAARAIEHLHEQSALKPATA